MTTKSIGKVNKVRATNIIYSIKVSEKYQFGDSFEAWWSKHARFNSLKSLTMALKALLDFGWELKDIEVYINGHKGTIIDMKYLLKELRISI